MIAMLSTRRVPTVATSSTSISQQTSSADAIAGNDDLLIQILLRLPISSLLKFKSISKHWFSLISGPHFYHLRHSKSKSVSGLFLHISSFIDGQRYKFVPLTSRPLTSPSFKPLSFINDPSRVKILQSCNGFLLCYFSNLGDNSKKYFIHNPTTQQLTLLPQLLYQAFNPVVGVGLAFDPSKSLHYKVVCVQSIDSVRPYRFGIEIYSSESCWWRQSGDLFTAPAEKFNHGVFWNGAVQWINNKGTLMSGNYLGIIVSFDVNEERLLREMPMPEIPCDWNQSRIKYFGESRNHLHLILVKSPGTTRFNVYEMEKDYSRWFVKYQVNLAVIIAAFPVMRRSILRETNFLYYTFSILCLVREEIDEDSFLVLNMLDKAVICYRFKEETF